MFNCDRAAAAMPDRRSAERRKQEAKFRLSPPALTILPRLRRFAHSQAQQIVDFAGFLC
jgi:hypothetical protein